MKTMKLLKYIICLLMIQPLALAAQNNLKKTLLGRIGVESNRSIYVRHGEFKVDFDNKITDADMKKHVNRYVVIVRDKNGKVRNVKINDSYINFNSSNAVEVLKAGYSFSDLVYTEKRKIVSDENTQYKHYLHISDKSYGPYDQILDMFPDGFTYKNAGVYSYRSYKIGDETVQNYPILDESEYENKTVRYYIKDKLLEFKPVDKVHYYTTERGNYYLLYYDDFMENTLLVVDSVGYELDGIMSKIDFKFSQNGKHWMAACLYNVMVDGVTVLRLQDRVKFLAINNEGNYAFVTKGKGMSDMVYLGDDVFVKGVEVRWFATDCNGKFNYIIKKGDDSFYCIDNEVVKSLTSSNNYYYSTIFDGKGTNVVKSNDGKHTMVYSYDSPYITIDDERIDFPSIPHYAKWDEGKGCFVWNAVEDVELYLYEYKVGRK